MEQEEDFVVERSVSFLRCVRDLLVELKGRFGTWLVEEPDIPEGRAMEPL